MSGPVPAGEVAGVKRSLDVVLGSLAALVTLPLVLVLALVLAVELRCWPFFVQERVGRADRIFRVVKLRTLPPTVSTVATKYELADVAIPPIARKLRELHLDELPQLWLVVAGRMSLVGPRPEMPSLHAAFTPEVRAARAAVRPGCTGLWQVSVASSGLMHEHPEYDLAYIRALSLRLDLWILARTVSVLLGGRSTVTLSDAPLVFVLPEAVATVDLTAVEQRAAV